MTKLLGSLAACCIVAAAMLVSIHPAAAQSRGRGSPTTVRGGGGGHKVPEISTHGAPAALALVFGGVAVVVGRRARRRDR
jgi:hypothetical protein